METTSRDPEKSPSLFRQARKSGRMRRRLLTAHRFTSPSSAQRLRWASCWFCQYQSVIQSDACAMSSLPPRRVDAVEALGDAVLEGEPVEGGVERPEPGQVA